MKTQNKQTTGEAHCCGNCEAFDYEDTSGNGFCLEGDIPTHCSNCCACHTLKQHNNGKRN